MPRIRSIWLIALFLVAFLVVANTFGSDNADVTVNAASVDCATVTDIPAAECEALVALYSATDGLNWLVNTGWLSDVTACDWYGISCAAGHVTQVDLSDNQLSGSIPPELGNLASLQYLGLFSNQLSGSIPPELGNLASLEYLVLYQNQLTGSIPPEFDNLASLQQLVLWNNQLSGSIPPELGNLARLQYLGLSNNQLSGSIPPGLGNLASLWSLDLAINQLSGSIPPELGNLASLLWLGLWGNQLSGSIPPELGNLASLEYLGLSINQLSGSIPPELGNLDSLQYLSLDRNQLSGSIPPELGNLASLTVLDLRQNQLSGSIPLSFTGLTALTSFRFSATTLCEPAGQAFQAWLGGVTHVESTGVRCIPEVDAGGPYTVDEGSTAVLDGSGSSDPDGEIVLYKWDLDGDEIFSETGVDAANGDEVGVSPTFDASLIDGPANLTICLRVIDNDGLADEICTQVEVVNVDPTVSATGDAIDDVDTATVSVSFTDPAVDDTHTAIIDWGDGTTPKDLGAVTSPFEAAHAFVGTGTYVVTVTVEDDDGGLGTDTATVSIAASDAFDPVTGRRLLELVIDRPPDGPGELYSPIGIATGSNGDIFVADRGNERIQRFDPDGQFIAEWPTTQGITASSFEPFYIAADGKGFLYITGGWGEASVTKYTEEGDYVDSWDTGFSGAGIAADGIDSVFVVDANNDKIFHYTEGGEFVSSWGVSGDGPGLLDFPYAVAADDGGRVLVTLGNFGDHRVQMFDADGNYVRSIGSDDPSDPGFIRSSTGVAFTSDGEIVVSLYSSGRVARFTGDGEFVARSTGGPRGYVYGVTEGLNGNIFVANFIFASSLSVYAPTLEFSFEFGLPGEDDLLSPGPVTVADNGDIFVIDRTVNRVLRFSSTGEYITSWGGTGNGDGQLSGPTDIAIGSDGTVIVADGQLKLFDADGNYLGTAIGALGRFLTVHPVDGSVFVLDREWPSLATRVSHFDADWNLIDQWTPTEPYTNEFYNLLGIAVTDDGSVFIAGAMSINFDDQRIRKFTSTGEFLTAFGERGELWQLLGIDTDSSGNLLAAHDHYINEYSSDGVLIAKWPAGGQPHDVAVGPDGRVVVTEFTNHTVRVFGSELGFIPVIGEIGDDEAVEGTPYISPVPIVEGTAPLMWTLVQGPAGMRVDENTGRVTWDEATGIGSEFAVVIKAENRFGETTADWHVSVISADLLTADAGGPYQVDEGDTVELDGSGSSYPDGEIVLYEWDLDGDEIFSETGVDAANGDETGVSPTFDASNMDGPQTVTVKLRAIDNDGFTAESSATVEVLNVAPDVEAGPNHAMDVGTSFELSTGHRTSTVHDPGIDDVLEIIVDWGDGIQEAGSLENGTGRLTNTHEYQIQGTYAVLISASDGDGGESSDSMTLFVTRPAVEAYDSDGSGFIEKDEAVRAVADYLLQIPGALGAPPGYEQVIDIVTSYFLQTPVN